MWSGLLVGGFTGLIWKHLARQAMWLVFQNAPFATQPGPWVGTPSWPRSRWGPRPPWAARWIGGVGRASRGRARLIRLPIIAFQREVVSHYSGGAASRGQYESRCWCSRQQKWRSWCTRRRWQPRRFRNSRAVQSQVEQCGGFACCLPVWFYKPRYVRGVLQRDLRSELMAAYIIVHDRHPRSRGLRAIPDDGHPHRGDVRTAGGTWCAAEPVEDPRRLLQPRRDIGDPRVRRWGRGARLVGIARVCAAARRCASRLPRRKCS